MEDFITTEFNQQLLELERQQLEDNIAQEETADTPRVEVIAPSTAVRPSPRRPETPRQSPQVERPTRRAPTRTGGGY